MNRVVGACWPWLCACLCIAGASAAPPKPETIIGYRLERRDASRGDVGQRFPDSQLATLEKLNRADREHLGRLETLVVPDVWLEDEVLYSPMPAWYAAARSLDKLIVLHVPGQTFGAYESGRLVRWGPISSGRRGRPTPEGLFHLTWRSTGHTSTIDPDWFMPWYFNFENTKGLSLHEYALPGRPASHRCVRLLSRDARWLYGWGEGWTLDASETRIIAPGTPLFIVGAYDFTAPPPWQSLEWLARPVELPPLPAEN